MKSQIIKYLIVLIALFSLSIGSIACNQQGNTSNSPKEVGEIIKLKIGKMTCGSCAYSSKIALQKVNHVLKVEVSYDTKIGTIYIEKGKSVNVIDLIKALEKIGYTAEVTS